MTATSGHARHGLDTVIHAPVRFSIVAALASVDEAEFALVRDAWRSRTRCCPSRCASSKQRAT